MSDGIPDAPAATGEDIYWAADELDKAVHAVDERVDHFYKSIQQGERTALLWIWRAMNRSAFSGFYTGGEIGSVGKQGEYRTVEVNEIGNLHQHLFTMITSQRPAFEAKTETIDASAQQQAPIAVAVVETALREKGLEDCALDVADYMLRAGEGWALKRWDPTKGPVYTASTKMGPDGQPVLDPETGQPQMVPVPAGDVAYTAYHPIDVPRDVSRPAAAQEWHVPRRRANKWHLAAQFPPLRDKILNSETIAETDAKRPRLIPWVTWSMEKDLCDDVWVYDALIDRSPALPEGRLISYVSTDCVLFDGPLPYKERPLYRAAAKEFEGTPFGYSLLWDCLAPQLAVNNLLSHATTLASQLGAVVWEPEGMGQSPSRWKGILTILKGGTVPPQVLDLLKIPDALFKLTEFYVQAMERITGVNAVARGQTAEGQKGLSGAAYALFASRAIEFGSRFQAAYNRFLEQIGTGTIRDYQDMGNGKYLVSMAGEGNAYRVQAFLGGRTDPGAPDPDGSPPRIDKIQKVSVRITNPLQSTTAGRMSMFDALKEVEGAIPTPEAAVQVLTTGKLEPATQSTQREMEAIAKENEMLGRGEHVSAMITDRHWAHIPEHTAVCASPEVRAVPAALEAATAHIEEHAAMLRAVDPLVLAVQGCPDNILKALSVFPPPPQPGMPPPGAQGSPGPGGPPPVGKPVPGGPPNPMPGDMPRGPVMPVEPLSGQRVPQPPPPAAR